MNSRQPLRPTPMLNKLLFSAIASLAFTTGCAAEPTLQLGQQVSPEEQIRQGFTVSHQVGEFTVKTMAPTANGATPQNRAASSGEPATTVINEQGVVGISRNEVLISQWPTDKVRSQASAQVKAAVKVTYYDHLQITSLRYASFADAVAARNQLAALLPQAVVGVPINYYPNKVR